MVSAKLPFMTRLPKKRGITQAEEDKSLILRQKVHLKAISLSSLPAYLYRLSQWMGNRDG